MSDGASRRPGAARPALHQHAAQFFEKSVVNQTAFTFKKIANVCNKNLSCAFKAAPQSRKKSWP